jgi:hypothetical protein
VAITVPIVAPLAPPIFNPPPVLVMEPEEVIVPEFVMDPAVAPLPVPMFKPPFMVTLPSKAT